MEFIIQTGMPFPVTCQSHVSKDDTALRGGFLLLQTKEPNHGTSLAVKLQAVLALTLPREPAVFITEFLGTHTPPDRIPRRSPPSAP